jgi:hypothetical protein
MWMVARGRGATASRRTAEADDDNTDDWQAELLHDVDKETFEKLDNIAADIKEMATRERWLFCRSCKSWHTVPFYIIFLYIFLTIPRLYLSGKFSFVVTITAYTSIDMLLIAR